MECNSITETESGKTALELVHECLAGLEQQVAKKNICYENEEVSIFIKDGIRRLKVIKALWRAGSK